MLRLATLGTSEEVQAVADSGALQHLVVLMGCDDAQVGNAGACQHGARQRILTARVSLSPLCLSGR